MGKPATDALKIVQKVLRIESNPHITSNDIESEAKEKHPRLFKGLGELKREFKIKLKADAPPFALTTPREVALPLMEGDIGIFGFAVLAIFRSVFRFLC